MPLGVKAKALAAIRAHPVGAVVATTPTPSPVVMSARPQRHHAEVSPMTRALVYIAPPLLAAALCQILPKMLEDAKWGFYTHQDPQQRALVVIAIAGAVAVLLFVLLNAVLL